MPTDLTRTNRFAQHSAAQIIEAQAAMLDRYAAEDAERAARHAAILATFEGR